MKKYVWFSLATSLLILRHLSLHILYQKGCIKARNSFWTSGFFRYVFAPGILYGESAMAHRRQEKLSGASGHMKKI